MANDQESSRLSNRLKQLLPRKPAVERPNALFNEAPILDETLSLPERLSAIEKDPSLLDRMTPQQRRSLYIESAGATEIAREGAEVPHLRSLPGGPAKATRPVTTAARPLASHAAAAHLTVAASGENAEIKVAEKVLSPHIGEMPAGHASMDPSQPIVITRGAETGLKPASQGAATSITSRTAPMGEIASHAGTPYRSGHGHEVRWDTPVSKVKRPRPALEGKALENLLGRDGMADRAAVQEARARLHAPEEGALEHAKKGFAKFEEFFAPADKEAGFFAKLAQHVGKHRIKYGLGGVGAVTVAAIAMSGGKKQEEALDRAASGSEVTR